MSPFASSFTLSSVVGTDQDSIDSPSIGANLNQDLEPMAPCIILEPEEEEKKEITPNSRVGFKERQPKCLSESLLAALSPTKRTCSGDPHEVPVPDASLVPMPSSNAAGSNQVLVVSSSIEKDAYSVQEKTSIDQNLGDDYSDKDVSVSSSALSWEEMAELLK